jgi:hypothetical protein
VEAGLAGNAKVMASTSKVAYQSVLPAWDWFLSHTQGKLVAVIGAFVGLP